MINLSASLALAFVVAAAFIFGLEVSLWASIPLGLVSGFVLFLFLGKKIQSQLEALMGQMQQHLQDQKFDRAIDVLKGGLSLSNRHFFVGGQLNSQIGMLYYLQKKHDQALEYFKKGFVKHYVGQGMMACVYYKRKDYDNMKKAMDDAISANKKESIIYSLYAYLLYQLKEKDEAMEVLHKGLKKLPDDERLKTNLTQLQNNKKLKMKIYGDLWVQFMLERPPRIQQQMPSHMRQSRKAMFR